MSTGGPPADEGDKRPYARESVGNLDDDQLLAALGEVLRASEPPPDWSLDLARSSYDLRLSDADLAMLTSDSALATARSAMRSAAAPRLTVFDADGLSVEIQIERGARAGSWELIGQLTPAAPARIQVRRQGTNSDWADADDLGRFAVSDLPAGPLSLTCTRGGLRPVVTQWIVIS